MRIKVSCAPEEMSEGLAAVRKALPGHFGAGGDALEVRFIRQCSVPSGAVRVAGDRQKVDVVYSDMSCAFRGLGTILGTDFLRRGSVDHAETSPFSMRGLMIDCSRNGVIRPDALKDFMVRAALMGVNMVMLYTEDTYEVPGERFFGYLRGAFTQRELRDIDRYAGTLGIEMIPCIQTLAHLEQVLQWDPYFRLRDLPHILLAGDRRTYEFVEKIVTAASSPFRSRRIHLGMDEAHGLGTGRFQQIFGRKDPFDIMNMHLGRVRTICRNLGLRPMIWSDMYFRLGSKTHDYYDPEWKIPARAVKDIPKDIQLVYWDYYHKDPEFYRKMIANHRKLGSDPVFAGGIWTWSHKWCALPLSFQVIEASMSACRSEKLREVFMTMWGDDGMEVDIFSALPAVGYFCEHAFSDRVEMTAVASRFEAVCGTSFKPWVKAAENDSVPWSADGGKTRDNTSVILLWQDPLFAIADPHMKPWEWRGHYERLARELFRFARRRGLSARLEYPARIADALALKSGLRRDLERAYRRRDRRALSKIAARDIPALQKAVRSLWEYHREMWMRTYKPFGWEVIEHRYGGLMARLQTVRKRVADYVSGRIDAIPELEAPLHDPWSGTRQRTLSLYHARVKTPSCIK